MLERGVWGVGRDVKAGAGGGGWLGGGVGG